MKSIYANLGCLVILVTFGVVLRASTPLSNELLAATLRVRSTQSRVRGYYENLARADGQKSPDVWAEVPKDYRIPMEGPNGIYLTDAPDWRRYRPKPNQSRTLWSLPWRSNRYGFRGPEWAEKPAPGVVRIVVLGASTTHGIGVRENEIYTSLTEERLNRASAGKYEILNLGVIAYSAVEQLALLEEALSFAPTVVLFVMQGLEVEIVASRVSAEEQRTGPDAKWKVDLLPPTLRERVIAATERPELEKLLAIELEALRSIAERCRDRGVRVGFAILPDLLLVTRRMTLPVDGSLERRVRRWAHTFGFTEIDLHDVYAGHDLPDLWVKEWDFHPSAQAHRLIAEALAPRLLEAREATGALLLRAPAPQNPTLD